jgi:hypothetical protein
MTMVNMVSKTKADPSTAKGSNPKISGEDTQSPPHLYLEHHHLEKLGIKKMPTVGEKLTIHAIGHVGSTSEDQDRGDGGKSRRMTLHLHKMEMGGGKQPEMSDESQKAGAKAAIDKALKRGAGGDGKNAEGAEG